MATSTAKLKFVFKTEDGSNMTLSYSNANTETEASTVSAAAQAIIDNGFIFSKTPTVLSSASLVVTNVTDYSIGG